LSELSGRGKDSIEHGANLYLSQSPPAGTGYGGQVAEVAEGIVAVDPMLRQMHRVNVSGTKSRCQVTNFTSAPKVLKCDRNLSFSKFCSPLRLPFSVTSVSQACLSADRLSGW